MLVSYLKRMEGLKIGQYEAALKTRELTKLYKLQELEPLFEDVRALLEQACPDGPG